MTTPVPQTAPCKPTLPLWAAIALISLCAFAICAYDNRFGADVLPDSGDYISTAVQIAHGNGYSEPNRSGPPIPMTWFPPLYPLLIAAAERAHLPLYRAIGLFDAACYALLTFMAAWWVWRCTASRLWAAMAGIIVLTNHAIYFVHSEILSEPLFLLWSTAALIFLSEWRRNAKYAFALAAGICISGGLLTRYAGASFAPAAAIIILCAPGVRWRRKLAALGLILAVGMGPSFVWSRWHTPPDDTATGRTLQWHPIPLDRLQDGVDTLASFVVPDAYSFGLPTPIIVGAACLVLVAGWIIIARRRGGESESSAARRAALRVCIVFVAVYIAFLVFSASCMDKDISLDARILSVIVPPLATIFCIWGQSLIAALAGRPVRVAACGGLAAILLIHANDVFEDARYDRQSAADMRWFPTLKSATLDALGRIPATAGVWSDKACAIFMACRLPTDDLPTRPDDPTADAQSAQDYAEAIQELRDDLTNAGGGWIVFWRRLSDFGDSFLLDDDVRRNFIIAQETHCDDGILMRIDNPQARPPGAVTQPSPQ
jgi:hypothetical protein